MKRTKLLTLTLLLPLSVCLLALSACAGSDEAPRGYRSRGGYHRLVPIGEVEPPRPEDVVEYARTDWPDRLEEAADSAGPVYGLDLPGLTLHTLQVGEVAWVRYATASQPGKIAAELLEYPETMAAVGGDAAAGAAVAIDPPHLLSEDSMPLPKDADFGQMLPEDLRREER